MAGEPGSYQGHIRVIVVFVWVTIIFPLDSERFIQHFFNFIETMKYYFNFIVN